MAVSLFLEVPTKPEPAALSILRRSLGDWLDAGGVPPRTVANVQLIVTELVANAREASEGAGQPVVVSCDVANGQVCLEVRDFGRSAELPDPNGDFAGGGRGRGLAIVRRLSDHIVIEREGAATHVRVSAGFR